MTHVTGLTDRRAVRPYIFPHQVLQVGYNPDVDNLDPPTEVWSVNTLVTWPTTAAPVDISSDDANDFLLGTGARTVRVVGVDAQFQEIEEIVPLAGLATVSTTQDFLFVNNMTILEHGSDPLETNIGNITALIGSDTVALMDAGAGRILQALGVVPRRTQTNLKAYLVRLYGGIAAVPTRTARVRFLRQDPGVAAIAILDMPLMSRAGAIDFATTPVSLDPGSRIWARVMTTDGGNNVQVSAGFEIAWW